MILLGLDEVLAQRMTGPILGHQDAAQVGVALEGDAEQVEDLPLLPVGVAPDLAHRRHHRVVARRVGFEDEPVAMRVREEMIDDLDDVPFRVVHPRLVREAVEAQRRIVAQEARDLGDLGGRHHYARVVARAGQLADGVAEAGAQLRVDAGRVLRRHGPRYARRPAGSVLRTSQRSCCIFSWSFMSPSMSASGRGGQPGTYTSTGITRSTPSHTE